MNQLQTRINVSSATFSFYKENGSEKISFSLFCGGADAAYVDEENPLDDETLLKLINDLKLIDESNAKKTIKIPVSFFTSVRISFSGFNVERGYKVNTFITGYFFFSFAFLNKSYMSAIDLNKLIMNLEQCIG